jgi:DNA topoisomerase II
MAKKIKLKPQQVKNTFNIFVKATLENPTFSSQVKSECTSKAQDFGSKFDPTEELHQECPQDWYSR